MASKLTSQASHFHRSFEDDFELGGVVAKSGCGKLESDGRRHDEAWFGGFCCDDNFFMGKGMMHVEGPQGFCEKEYLELDYLSKEMVFQETISTDRPTPWLDLNTTTSNLFKDECIISTLTVLAALLNDWCLVEKDLIESVVNGKNGASDHGCKNHMHFDDLFDAEKEAEILTPLLVPSDGSVKSNHDFQLEMFFKEGYRDHSTENHSATRECVIEPAQAFNLKLCKGDLHVCESSNLRDCPRSRSEQMADIYGHLLQFNWNSLCSKDDFKRAAVAKCIFSAAVGNFSDFIGFHKGINTCPVFGKSIPAASRFSFCRDSSALADTELQIHSGVPDELGVREDYFGSNQNKDSMVLDYNGWCEGGKVEYANTQGEDLVPEGLLYTLSYMNLHDLLTMEKVCRSLRNRIKNDVLLWQRLHVELPMSNHLTDEVLLKLASRSKGQLQCLSLVDCTRVTEAALEEVVLSNPRLVKLSLPGCSRISADAVVRIVEKHRSKRVSGVPTLRQLRVRNMDGFTKDHLEKLQKVVSMKSQEHSDARKPRFYHQKHHTAFQDDGRAIDVEECPICTNVRLVYDCTRERCYQKETGTRECRACILCIVRCEACGRCITDNDYEETFSLDVLCSYCWLGLPKCAECNRPANGSHIDHFIRTSDTTFVCCGTSSEIKGLRSNIYT